MSPQGRTSLKSGSLVVKAKSITVAGRLTVTQITTRSTAVTINAESGQITTDDTSLAGAASATFTVNNDKVFASDIIIAVIRSSPDADSIMELRVSAVAAGSFDLTLENLHATNADTGAIIINFTIVHASA